MMKNTWQRWPAREPDKMWVGDYLPVIVASPPDESYRYDMCMALYDPSYDPGEVGEHAWYIDMHGKQPDVDITDRVVAFIEPPYRDACEWAKERKAEL